MKFEAPTIDEIIRHCIDKIWIQYDDDGNGYLDREETKAFIRDSLKGDDGQQSDPEDEDENMTDNMFEACFRKFDDDGSGVISKDEMLDFLKLMADLTDENDL